MKKKIIIGLTVFCLIFFIGGIYIIVSIESATSKLDNLIMLHQVGILREHLLFHVEKVQSDLYLKNTRYARNIDTVIKNVSNMENMSNACLTCHHSEDMEMRLHELNKEVKEYKSSISRLFTLRANRARLIEEEDRAFKKGEVLADKVNNMINIATIKLEDKTRTSLEDITGTKVILYLLVAIVPFLAGGLGFIFIRGFTRPVNTLLNATRKLKAGDLDHRIEELKDEFGEVAASFNDMSSSLKDNILKIQENEKRYRLLFESAGDAIFMLDAEGENIGRIVSANKAAAEMHGYSVDELLGMNMIKDLDTPDAAADSMDRIKKMRQGKWINEELTHRKKDGTVFTVEISAGLFEFMGHEYILAFDRDITERKKSEIALLRSHVMFTTVLDSIEAIIYVSDMETYKILYLNRYARSVFGDIDGKVCWQNTQPGLEGPCEFCSRDKLLTSKGEPAGVFHREYHNTINDIWYDIFDRAIEWVDGSMVRFEIATDITERKKIDETLRRAEQMKLVGEWAAGLAHEIKNALAGIKISVEVLSEELSLTEDNKVSILRAVDETKRIELLLNRMLNFAKPPELRLSSTDINEILDNSVGLSVMQTSNTAGNANRIEVLKDYDDNLPNISADPLQLRQVFMNLIMNANDAMGNSGTLTLRTSYNETADSIFIEFSDTGEGLTTEIIENIYKPFFTTKSKGSGLGLAISKRIIELHGGAISAENRPGGGAMFSIRIPVAVTEKGY
jgi:PAS domain S-box-containing protein